MKNIYIPPILVQSSTLKGINEYNEDKDGFLYSMLTKYKKSNSNSNVWYGIHDDGCVVFLNSCT